MTKHNDHRIRRLSPCPAYDVAGMEGWLEKMALKGWFLTKDRIFAGVATFERGKPRMARYRLTFALKSTSTWADNGGNPDP